MSYISHCKVSSLLDKWGVGGGQFLHQGMDNIDKYAGCPLFELFTSSLQKLTL